MKAGFHGGLVIDYPNSSKAKKYDSLTTADKCINLKLLKYMIPVAIFLWQHARKAKFYMTRKMI